MIRIKFPEFLAWFQTPQTVSRPSRPDFQPRQTNSGTRRPIEIFKKSKMIRIEFPEFLAWFQTPQTVSRPSRPNFQPHRTVEHTSHKSVSLQPPFTLKPRPKGAKKIFGLVPDTSYRFQTVQTQFPASQGPKQFWVESKLFHERLDL